VVPWLWFLSLSSDCRVFQNLSVLDIAEQVFKDQGYSDFEIRCTKSYAKREYCVQYRETHLNFVSRLLEDEGIFYFFEHADDKHVLVLADSPSAVKACPNQAGARMAATPGPWQEEDVVTAFEREHAVHAGKVTLRDYDYLQPALQLESSVSGDGDREVYDYPGKFAALEEGARYARLQLEEREALRQVVRGESTCRAFRSGYRFDLKEHYRRDANQAYQLLQVWHSARGGDYAAGDVTSCQYSNTFVAIPHSVPFRPPRRASKPVVQGAQTAVVVGKSGEEIWVDKHGRVKVQFYWDRNGKKDENSSCWVRVATTWGGKNWGFIQIPRIGQEVIIEFLEGDPDRPIITGRVYNADQTPPYVLPDNQTQSGVKSRSSKGGSGENFNEIRFEDMKGSEVLFIHAEKDKQVEVENDRTESVGHDEKIDIGNDRTESVGKNETITIGENRTESVGKDEKITIGANRTASVAKNETIDIGQSRNETVGKNEDVSIGDNRSHTVGKSDKLTVGKELLIGVADKIVVQTGEASITMKKNGDIQIKGNNITIQGSGKIQVKASSEVNIKGSKVTNN
ncbi:MAG: type VI secretion system Vgr family protein, partial [Gammaproteobacteria bacterium]